eukprot:3899384-Amphidinium_carterae.2
MLPLCTMTKILLFLEMKLLDWCWDEYSGLLDKLWFSLLQAKQRHWSYRVMLDDVDDVDMSDIVACLVRVT